MNNFIRGFRYLKAARTISGGSNCNCHDDTVINFPYDFGNELQPVVNTKNPVNKHLNKHLLNSAWVYF
ncbi:hypothetical protein CANTEDRAFT_112069 [Yamadazyma tenuis ATCC 10573]|uniref:Uncharacterized protein n=1 Tax=Candida tenuis (strain ATCC 10573 / BCRC 21748 / CBS 615 / JCM 9827 / NBRC 10315 / NRRL Y-1498 / VKM Y-70) TaxID=590646 RepID=G3AVY5_CANTC|nr:uncharacterized protein CANTEDRAFT_112069 [Yamadazyma tenuis ATCC 10573]EGV66897.1 hypothetical protein CANTEDRAFT_112069 [Yamadazyma tenuis ATCC 10573]